MRLGLLSMAHGEKEPQKNNTYSVDEHQEKARWDGSQRGKELTFIEGDNFIKGFPKGSDSS